MIFSFVSSTGSGDVEKLKRGLFPVDIYDWGDDDGKKEKSRQVKNGHMQLKCYKCIAALGVTLVKEMGDLDSVILWLYVLSKVRGDPNFHNPGSY